MSFPVTKKSEQWQQDSLCDDCNVCQRRIVGKYFKSGKHHCRRCGRIICSDCSKYKYMNHRICYDCNLRLNPMHNNQKTNPYIDSNIIKAQREFSPEKNKQFEFQHQIIVENQSKSKQSKISKLFTSKSTSPTTTTNKPTNIHPKPFKPPPMVRSNSNKHKRSNRSIPPPPPLPPPPGPPPLKKKQSNTKLHINGDNIKHQNDSINAIESNGLSAANIDGKIDNKVSDVQIEKKENGKVYAIDNNAIDTEKKEEIKYENNVKIKKDKKSKSKRDKRRKKRRKHGKHYRNDAVTEMDDITTEIFLKLLLSFEALEEDEEKKRKKRKKRKKKAKSQRSRSKQRKTARNKHKLKPIENIAAKSEALITTNREEIIKEKEIISMEHTVPEICVKTEEIIPVNSNTDEIKVIEKHEIEIKNNVKNIKSICCGASLREYRNKWVRINGNTFNIRPKNYYSKKKKGKKVPSKDGIYNVFAVDAYAMNDKLKFWDVMNKYNINVSEHVNGMYVLPSLVIVNIMLPLKDKGLQLSFYSKLSDESVRILENNNGNLPEAMELFGRFIDFCMGNEDDMADELEEAFKITVRLNNLKDTKLPFLMKKLIKRANGQSIAINENSEYYLNENKSVFVIDIDGYKLSKSSLTMWNKVNLVLDSMIYDVGFHLGAHDANYLPEQMLLCTQINKLAINDFTSIHRKIN